MLLTRISLPARDPRAMAAFYRDLLELPVVIEDDHVAVTLGWSRLEFFTDPSFTTSHHLAFTIPGGVFDSAKQWIAARPSLIKNAEGRDEFEATPSWNGRNFYFDGPETSILELIERRDRHDQGEGSFGSHQLRGISEVGVAVDADVRTTARRLESEAGIAAYAEKPDETFGAIGTIDGLLILTAAGRNWFPTSDRPVGPARGEIEATGATPGTYHVSAQTTLTVTA